MDDDTESDTDVEDTHEWDKSSDHEASVSVHTQRRCPGEVSRADPHLVLLLTPLTLSHFSHRGMVKTRPKLPKKWQRKKNHRKKYSESVWNYFREVISSWNQTS